MTCANPRRFHLTCTRQKPDMWVSFLGHLHHFIHGSHMHEIPADPLISIQSLAQVFLQALIRPMAFFAAACRPFRPSDSVGLSVGL